MMSKRTKQKPDKNQRSKPVYWNQTESQRLLNFIISNKHHIFVKVIQRETFEELQGYVETKDYTQCYDKINNLKVKYKSYDRIIEVVNLKAKLSKDEIQEKEEKKNYMRARKLEHLFQKLDQIMSLKERVLKVFEANFNPLDILIQYKPSKSTITDREEYMKRLIYSQNSKRNKEVFTLKMLKFEKNPLEKTRDYIGPDKHVFGKSKDLVNKENQPQNFQKRQKERQKEQQFVDLWNRIDKLRYIIFIHLYKQNLEINQLNNPVWGIYWRMADYIETKNSLYCFLFHREQLKKSETVEKVIERMKEELLFTFDSVNEELQRIENFIQKDYSQQQNAFQNDQFQLRNPYQNLKPFVFQIMKQLEKGLEKWVSNKNYKENFDEFRILVESQQQQIKQRQNVILVKIPFQVEIDFSRRESFFSKHAQPTQCVGFQQSKNILKDECTAKQDIKNQQKISGYYFIQKTQDFLRLPNSDKISLKKYFENEENQYKLCEEDALTYNPPNIRYPLIGLELQNLQKSQKQDRKIQKRFSFWTLSEKIKFIAFTAVNKDLLTSSKGLTQLNEKYFLFQKLARYIGTYKTQQKCHSRLLSMKHDYNHDIVRMISEESQKLGITKILNSDFQADPSNMMCFKADLGASVLKLEVYPRVCTINDTDIEDQIEQIIRKRLLIKPSLIFRHQDRKLAEKESMSEKMEEEKSINGIREEDSQDSGGENCFIKVKIRIGIETEVYDELVISEEISGKKALPCKKSNFTNLF